MNGPYYFIKLSDEFFSSFDDEDGVKGIATEELEKEGRERI